MPYRILIADYKKTSEGATKGWLRAIIFKSADTAYLIASQKIIPLLWCYSEKGSKWQQDRKGMRLWKIITIRLGSQDFYCKEIDHEMTLQWKTLLPKITNKANFVSEISWNVIKNKGRLRANIFKSADTAHLLLLCFLGDAIRCAMSAD